MRSVPMRIHPTLRHSLIYLLPLAILLLAVIARIAASDILDRLSLICFDLYQKAAPREAGNAPIRIVDIDDDSLAQIGQWPWPRSVVGQLTDKLREAGAAVIAFDIDFAEPDRTSPAMLLPLLTQNGVGTGEARRLLTAVPDPDQRLAEAMRKVPVVTGFIMVDRGGNRPPVVKAGFAFVGNDPLGHVAGFPTAIADLPVFEDAAAGKLRLAVGARGYIGRAAGANGERSFGENTGLTALRIGQLAIPTDAAGRVWLYYAPPRPDRRISAAAILRDNFDHAAFADHIVLIGTSAKGVINDEQATPIAPDVPGVEIHAQLIEQILQQAFLARPDWAVG